MGHQLVISQPGTGGVGCRQIRNLLGGVGRLHSVFPVGPGFLPLLPRIDPIGQIGQPCKRADRSLAHGALCQPGSERVDGFEFRNLHCIFRRHHVVGMHHLRHTVEQLDLPRHDAPRAGRQRTVQVVRVRAKKHDLERGFCILNRDAIGSAALRGGAMLAHRHLDSDNLGKIGPANASPSAPVNSRLRQGKSEVDRSFNIQRSQDSGRFRPHPRQRLDLGK